jgi:hypothetical protein
MQLTHPPAKFIGSKQSPASLIHGFFRIFCSWKGRDLLFSTAGEVISMLLQLRQVLLGLRGQREYVHTLQQQLPRMERSIPFGSILRREDPECPMSLWILNLKVKQNSFFSPCTRKPQIEPQLRPRPSLTTLGRESM